MLNKDGLKRIEGFFLSRRTAVLLLVLTIASLITANRLQMVAELTASPLFLILPLFIFASVSICTLNRLRRRSIKIPTFWPEEMKRSVSLEKKRNLKDCLHLLRGWTVVSEREDGIVMSRGHLGFWGSMVFHLGLLLLIVSAFTTAASLFMADILLTQGEAKRLDRSTLLNVLRDPLISVTMPAGTIELEQFSVTYHDERFPVDYMAQIKISDDVGGRTFEVRINDPLILEGLQYTMDEFGYAPGFQIKKKDGELLFDGFVSLLFEDGDEDFFSIPETSYRLYVKLFPDFEMTDAGAGSRSKILKNPVLGIRLIDWKNQEVERGKLVPMGRSVDMGDLTISFVELRNWAHFGVIRDFGEPMIAAAFLLITAGLIIRFVWYEKWLMIAMRGPLELEIAGYTKYFPALFEEEMGKIAGEIKKKPTWVRLG